MRRHGKCDSLNTEMVMQNRQIRQNPQVCPVSVEDASARIWKMPLSPIERWWWKPSTRRGTGLEDPPAFPEILRGSPWQKNNAHQRRLKQPWLFRYLDRIWKTCGFPEHDNFSGRPYISMSFFFHFSRCFLWDAVAKVIGNLGVADIDSRLEEPRVFWLTAAGFLRPIPGWIESNSVGKTMP